MKAAEIYRIAVVTTNYNDDRNHQWDVNNCLEDIQDHAALADEGEAPMYLFILNTQTDWGETSVSTVITYALSKDNII